MVESRIALTNLVRSTATLLLAFGVPVALFTTFFSREAMYLLGGKAYLNAAPALATLVWTFPSFLILGALYSAVQALNKQAWQAVAFGATAVFNIVLNVIFIPHYSYMASSVLTTASELLNGAIVIVVLRRNLGPLGLATPFVKVGLISAFTALILWVLQPFGIFVGLPIGVLMMLAGYRLAHVLGEPERAILTGLPKVGRFARWL